VRKAPCIPLALSPGVAVKVAGFLPLTTLSSSLDSTIWQPSDELSLVLPHVHLMPLNLTRAWPACWPCSFSISLLNWRRLSVDLVVDVSPPRRLLEERGLRSLSNEAAPSFARSLGTVEILLAEPLISWARQDSPQLLQKTPKRICFCSSSESWTGMGSWTGL
jgi:hypothetical protein